MPRKLSAALLVLVSSLLLSAPAAARPVQIPLNKLLVVPAGSGLAEVESLDVVPSGWTASARQAIVAAEHTSAMQQLHRRMHPLHVVPFVWRAIHPYWYIEFTYGANLKLVADVSVSPTGKVTGVWTGRQAEAPYTHGHLNWVIASWMVLLPGALLFMLPFLDPRRLRRLTHLDGLAVVAFLVSWGLLAGAHLESAVWLAYPPLIYLLVRMLKLGLRGGSGSGRIAPLLSMRTLLIGLPLILAGRIVLSLIGHQEIDVGYESVIGAFRVLHHLPIYYNDPNHGDTYGPLTYLAYVPFELLFPWTNSLSNLHAADFAAIFFDLGTIVGLVLLGRRLRPGREGMRLGLVLAWAWAACPFTTISLVVHTNDGLVAMLSVFALLALSSPMISGTLLGLATAAKFSPAGLLPLLAAPRQRGWKHAIVCTGAFGAVVVTAVIAWLPPGGFSYFWQRTIHYQMVRLDVFSPWALHPALHPIQVLLEVAAVGLVATVAFLARERSLAQVCALAAAITIAIELPAQHWFFYYIAWFLPFVLVALLARDAPAPMSPSGAEAPAERAGVPAQREPALVGA